MLCVCNIVMYVCVGTGKDVYHVTNSSGETLLSYTTGEGKLVVIEQSPDDTPPHMHHSMGFQ